MKINNISINKNLNYFKSPKFKSNKTANNDINTGDTVKKQTRLDKLKENFAEGALLLGDGIFIANMDEFKNTKEIKKDNPIADKLLLGFAGLCVLVTAVEIVLAIKEYIDNKKEKISTLPK